MDAGGISPDTGRTKRPRGRPSSRDAMLDAAQELALKEGPVKLTLDAVARRAGVSKGGLMYNFPTKQALLLAMIERIVEHNHRAHIRAISALPDQPGRNLRAYVRNSVRPPDADDQLSGALLAALVAEPELRAAAADYFARRFQMIAKDLTFEHAAVVHLATEGLWILELLKMSPFSKAQRARVVRQLFEMADAGVRAT